jgi:predicted RNA-binding protein YlxR (DUF448 family)
VACRTARPKRDLLRVVRTPDRRVLIDDTGRVSGRGAYVCRDGDCAAKAIETGVLGRALETRIPDELRRKLGSGAPIEAETNDERMTSDEGGAHGEE